MESGLDLSIVAIIMPVLTAIIILIIAILLIIVFYKSKRSQSLDIQSFEVLAQELKADNKVLRSEIEAVRKTLDSIDKMMKEIE